MHGNHRGVDELPLYSDNSAMHNLGTILEPINTFFLGCDIEQLAGASWSFVFRVLKEVFGSNDFVAKDKRMQAKVKTVVVVFPTTE